MANTYQDKTGKYFNTHAEAAASNVAMETNPNPSSLKDTLPPPVENNPGNMSNLRVALRAALGEATSQKASSNITMLSPLLEGGAAPNVITAAIGLAQGGLKETQDRMFSDIMQGVSDEQKLADDRKKQTMTSIEMMMDNGVFGDTPDGSLLALEKQAGLAEGSLLAWKARYNIAKKQGDDKFALEQEALRSQIAENKAQTAKAYADASEGSGTGPAKEENADDLLQQAINANMSASEAALDVASYYESKGIQVDKKTLDKWTAKAKGLKKVVTPAGGGTADQPLTPIFGTGSDHAKKTSIDARVQEIQNQNTKMGFSKTLGLKDQLVREGYPPQEIQKRTADVFEKIESATSSFFGNLFK